MAASFDLIAQPWVPVRLRDRLTEVSLEEVLLRARDFERIEDPSPLVTAALHRFLLAVLHRALEGPRDLQQATTWFRQGLPETPVRDYLARYRDRFDLFHPTAPFYQTPDFEADLSSRSWTVLTPELNSDNNKVLFDHTVTAQPAPLHPAAAARLLIANQTFALGGGRSYTGYTTSAPVATAAIILVQGNDLHETLCLNAVPYPSSQRRRDSAPWERQPLTVVGLLDGDAAKRAPRGIVDRYTWPARAIRLHAEERAGETVIFRISYASGVRCEDLPNLRDPLVAYRRDVKDPTRVYPLGFRAGRAIWRDFHTLLPDPEHVEGADVLEHAGGVYEQLAWATDEPETAVQVMVLGQANDQAKVEFWRGERYQLPATLLAQHALRQLIRQCLEIADETGRHLNSAARALAERLLTVGDRRPHKDDITRLTGSFPHQAAYWSALEEEFAGWLAGLGSDAVERRDERQRDWSLTVERQARRAWELTTRAAGTDARALRAIFASEGLLLAHLARRRRKEAA